VVVLVPRFVHTLRGDWGDTRVALPPGVWTNLFSGARLEGGAEMAAVFAAFPVALLYREDATTEEAA
jgi:(1->4)-alpha-D-glucan 1-alpha-D-glucosylmutase